MKTKDFNRSYSVEVMYLEVIACPQYEDSFDGLIMLERV